MYEVYYYSIIWVFNVEMKWNIIEFNANNFKMTNFDHNFKENDMYWDKSRL